MSPHRHRAASAGEGAQRPLRRYGVRASIGLGAVGLLAGLLFSTSASLAADSPERRPSNLSDLVRVESERLEETRTEVLALREEVAELHERQADPAAADEELQLAAGTVAVTGPGLVVRLWDAPVPVQLPEGVNADDLVVHQQDLESVMNGLWAGGAEAMTVQGHRVTATSSVRCVGNVLLIDGATYSPPYVIAAIGDPETLHTTLESTLSVQIYLQYVESLNLGWDVDEEDALTMPADSSNLTLEYADVPG
jgi:uncharacterized protein YlxW (UPF0749 family)